jgi:hypothetical protein
MLGLGVIFLHHAANRFDAAQGQIEKARRAEDSEAEGGGLVSLQIT